MKITARSLYVTFAIVCPLTLGHATHGYSQTDEVAEGKYLTAAAGCMACHTASQEGATPYAGGHALKTPFGTFYTPNITPDTETGIGNWTEDQFLNALKQGVRPDGSHYFPAFPYPSYRKMTDEDGLKIFAYLKSLEPVKQVNKEHDIGAPFSWRWLQFGWKMLFFKDKDYAPPADKSAEIVRGGYLVQALGHCGECHTPRNSMGGPIDGKFLAGSLKDSPGGAVPNITPDSATGIGDWSKGDLISFFETTMKPDFDNVQGAMEDVITHGTSKLTKGDRAAMSAYLLSLAPLRLEKNGN